MLRGVTTVRFHTTDLDAAKRWYTQLLGIEPYFDRPGYAEYRIGDYEHELGLLDTRYTHTLGSHAHTPATGAVIYWHVDDAEAALTRLLALGATLHEPLREFGDGFTGASVTDPFGNVLGIMQNRHYVEILTSRQQP
ncbi:glyoxalase [Streptomyces sp. V2]|uniref:VOC family protein n=1 Tax=Streptomyces TaxID=1883 RepID=UPI000D66BC68|nr:MULTISPECIES: VOC family protein [unclassified Streptomyces]PWG13533.1 glyoxalase [Streptomyces sp. V2]QZZ32417.1 VOC family protein [Streptomyces sp. ST1015]